MLTFHSFLQTVFHFVKSLSINISKKLYRNAAVLMTGTAVVAVITFTSSGFGGAGKNALAAVEDSPEMESVLADELEEPEETEIFTEAKIQAGLTESRRQGQLLVGTMLTKNVHRKQQIQASAKAEIEKINREIVMAAQAAEEEEKRKASRAIPLTDEDYQVFLRIVEAEAGICDDRGKILVANVIINRVKDSEFPNNVTDVVYQRSQFSPVMDGSLNRVKVSKDTIECVDRALAGEDYSNGALYFMFRGGSQNRAVRWFDRHLTFLFSHQNHEFFK